LNNIFGNNNIELERSAISQISSTIPTATKTNSESDLIALMAKKLAKAEKQIQIQEDILNSKNEMIVGLKSQLKNETNSQNLLKEITEKQNKIYNFKIISNEIFFISNKDRSGNDNKIISQFNNEITHFEKVNFIDILDLSRKYIVVCYLYSENELIVSKLKENNFQNDKYLNSGMYISENYYIPSQLLLVNFKGHTITNQIKNLIISLIYKPMYNIQNNIIFQNYIIINKSVVYKNLELKKQLLESLDFVVYNNIVYTKKYVKNGISLYSLDDYKFKNNNPKDIYIYM